MKKLIMLLVASLITSHAIHAELVVITNQGQFNKVAQGNKPVIVKFTAPWCSACSMIKKPFEELANSEEFNTIAFVEVDVDRNPAVANSYKIQSLPTFVYLSNGKPVHRYSAASSALKSEVRANVRKYFNMGAKEASKPVQQEAVQPMAQPADEQGIWERIKNFFSESYESIKKYFGN